TLSSTPVSTTALPRPPRSTLFPYTTLFRSHGLESAHVFAAGDHISPPEGAVDGHDALHHIVIFPQLRFPQFVGQGLHEVPPDDGSVLNPGDPPGGNNAGKFDLEMGVEIVLYLRSE